MNTLAIQIILSSKNEDETMFKAKALGTKSSNGTNAIYTFIDGSTLHFDQMFGKVVVG